MKLALRYAALALSILTLSVVPTAQAAKPKPPKSVSQLESYKFVVKKKGAVLRMKIHDEEYGTLGGRNSGFIDYEVAKLRGKTIVHIDLVKGMRRTRGVGKMLTAEVLRRYPKERIKASLDYSNRKLLLQAWAKGYPHQTQDTDGESLRDEVPAFKFDGFDYIITPIGNSIHLIMTPAKIGKNGSIVIEKPRTLDKILVDTAPKLLPQRHRPASDQEIKKEERENEAAAKDVAKMVADFAEDLCDDRDLDEDDLLEHLLDLMDKTCGGGGSSGSGWAEECLFTKKSRTYVVEIKDGGESFDLDDWLKGEGEDYDE